MSESHSVLYESGDGVARISLNRPERRNALTLAMLAELGDLLRRAAQDISVRAVVVSGEGRGFCAGQDLGVFQTGLSGDEVRDSVRQYYKPVILEICTMPKPVIAAVHGVAAGAGASLALACDLCIMAEDAALLQAFSNIGLVPDAGSTWFLARRVGTSRAFEIAVEGERISAQRCLELGLANRVTSAARLHEDALEWAKRLAQRPTFAVALTHTPQPGQASSSPAANRKG
jgi:2-(1,2-epoxy-1,2-dihydrophenyl)acetyl-CoA isomerase